MYGHSLVKQKVTLPFFPISLGICPRPFKTRYVLDVFIIVIIQKNLGLIFRGIPRRSGLRDHPRLYNLWGLSHCQVVMKRTEAKHAQFKSNSALRTPRYYGQFSLMSVTVTFPLNLITSLIKALC